MKRYFTILNLLKHIKGALVLCLYVVNLSLWFSILVLFALLRLIPILKLQRFCQSVMQALPSYWIQCNGWIQSFFSPIVLDILGLDQIQAHHWYLLICNHQSWADILILQHVFNRKIPLLKFFLKRQLLWTLPIASWACYLLGFPIMHRYSKKTMLKHPELKGKDLEATRNACRTFKTIPSTVTNFVEGTRFTEAKRQARKAPYYHLLQPRSAGVAFALAVLSEQLRDIIDVTLIYSSNKNSVWDFLCGKIPSVAVRIRVLPITDDLIGDYEQDREFRIYFQRWLNRLWSEKDQWIQQYKAGIKNLF